MRLAHEVAPGPLRLLGTVRHGAKRMMTAVGIPADLSRPFAGRPTSTGGGGGGGGGSWYADALHLATVLLQLLLVVRGAHVVASAALALLGAALDFAQRMVRLPLATAGSSAGSSFSFGSASGSSGFGFAGASAGASPVGGKLAVGADGGDDTTVVGLDLLVVVRGAHVVAPAALALLGTAVLLAQRPALPSSVHLQPLPGGSHAHHGGGRQGLLLEILGLVGVGRHPLLEVEAAHLLVPGALALLGAVGDRALPAAAIAAGNTADGVCCCCDCRCDCGVEGRHLGLGIGR